MALTTDTQAEAREALKDARLRLLEIHDGLDMNTPESLAIAYVTTEMRVQLGKLDASDLTRRSTPERDREAAGIDH